MTHIGDWTFGQCGALTRVNLPTAVTGIGNYAFYECQKLSDVTFPPNVINIGDFAFAACSGLRSVEFLGNAPTLGLHVFDSEANGFVVKCHEGRTGFTLPTWNHYSTMLVAGNIGLTGSFSFGTVLESTTATATMTIFNTGTTALAVNSICYPTGFSGDWAGGSIAASGSQNVTVSFSPTAIQSYDGTLTVTSSLPDCSLTANLTGTGVGLFTCLDTGTTITITGAVINPNGNLNIPSSLHGKPVTRIEDGAFLGCSGLTSVTIPNTVTSIGKGAFKNCSGLTGCLTIPSSVSSIGDEAFWGCSQLWNVFFMGNAPAMGKNVFGSYWVFPSNSLFIPTLYYLAESSGFTSPTWIDSSGDSYNTVATSRDGFTCLVSNNQVTITGYLGADSSISIPSVLNVSGSSLSVTGFCGAQSNFSLTHINLPASVTSIGTGAFDCFYNLTSITVDPMNSVLSSSSDGVLLDKQQSTILRYPKGKTGGYTIPDHVVTIGYGAFAECSGLASVTIPASVSNIGSYAFAQCNGLTSVTIPSGVTSISVGSFCYCTGLINVTIPGAITAVGDGAFYGCSALTSADFLGNAPTLGVSVFEGSANGFILKCHSGNTGFSSPTWCNYPIVDVDSTIALSGNLAFGTHNVNSTSTTTLTIQNTGTVGLTVTNINYPDGFGGDWSGGTLAAGASQNVMVTFSPKAFQSYSGLVKVATDMTGWTTAVTVTGAVCGEWTLTGTTIGGGNVVVGSGSTGSIGSNSPLSTGGHDQVILTAGCVALGGSQANVIQLNTSNNSLLNNGSVLASGGWDAVNYNGTNLSHETLINNNSILGGYNPLQLVLVAGTGSHLYNPYNPYGNGYGGNGVSVNAIDISDFNIINSNSITGGAGF